MAKRTVAVTIAGHEYRIRSDDDEVSLQKVAATVDVSMTQIRERTGTVDSLDVATLTALNLARELLALREKLEYESGLSPTIDVERADFEGDSERVTALIELVQSALDDCDGGAGRERDVAADGGTGQGRKPAPTPPQAPEVDPTTLLALSSDGPDGEDDAVVLQPS